MRYVDLERKFVPISRDQEANLHLGQIIGHRYAGWLSWSDLLEHRRVVLLAEALSGKTEEFRHQARSLSDEGKAAFFVRIEDLADDGFEAALDPPAVRRFEGWRASTDEEGWFFLDSVDEARLIYKSLERALRRFRRELDRGLDRSRIYVSCRWSDWNGSADRKTIEDRLPVWKKPTPPADENDDSELLDPIFKDQNATGTGFVVDNPERKTDALLVVQIIPLDAKQRRLLAEAGGIHELDVFVKEIERNGLDEMAERPGDLLDLAEYWGIHGRFGSLAEMTEHGIRRKLEELDKYRRDNKDLSPDKARHGAERLAAALTLAKTFTLRSPTHDPDPSLASGALNPADVLHDWTDADRNALMRRGIFAPSTYGRIRFHSRRTQDYLTARWLSRLLQAGCARSAVWDLVFAERYGVKTLVPPLHATAAWLALEHPCFRDEIIQREPLVLLREGDPRSLPPQAKEQLLLCYANLNANAEVSDDFIDQRAVWLFAAPALGEVIQRCWGINNREYFRLNMLRLIGEGAIQSCAYLARDTATDETNGSSLRIAALDALAACRDTRGLEEIARWLKAASGRIGVGLCSHFAKVLFPDHLTVDELLDVIKCSPTPSPGTLEGFGQVIFDIWKACPDLATQERLLAGVAELSLSPPFMSDHERISSKHRELARSLAPLAREVVYRLGDAVALQVLVRLLMAVERANRRPSREQEGPSLTRLVSENLLLKRRLFWADVEEVRRNTSREEDLPARFWQVYYRVGNALWKLNYEDLGWLLEDLARNSRSDDKRIALSAFVSIQRESGRLDDEIPKLKKIVSGKSELENDLGDYLAPQVEPAEVHRFRRQERRQQRAQDESDRKAKASWIRFRQEIKADPSLLSNRMLLADWSAGAVRLFHLTNWLSSRTKKVTERAALEWRLLESAFGWPVADAYREGMKSLWRVTKPERPKRKAGGLTTWKHVTILSYAGIGIEASEDPDWARRLKATDAERAVQHACLSEQGCPDWLEDLLGIHEMLVLPILQKEFRNEWFSQHEGRSYFWMHYSQTDKEISESVQKSLFEIVIGAEPRSLAMLDCGLRILQRLDLGAEQRRQVATLARRRLRASRVREEDDRVLRYLGMLFIGHADRAVGEFEDWLDLTESTARDIRARGALVALFGWPRGLVYFALNTASVASLDALIRFAYLYVRPEDDSLHEGIYTPNERDEAEEARSALLKALVNRTGADAYRAVKSLAEERVCRALRNRLKELAHGKAERDAELPAWRPAEVLAFEQEHIAPAKTGEALLHVVLGVLSDIQASFSRDDMSSRSLLERAEDEGEVQAWLAEQMNLRSRGRFHAHCEVQVSDRDKPDIVISSTAARVELAVEVKHGGKRWTVRDLERALTNQLARKYLKPETRRHGVLVVSYHRQRTWREPETREILKFQNVIERLKTLAQGVVRNDFGHVEVRVFGIDTSRASDESCGRAPKGQSQRTSS